MRDLKERPGSDVAKLSNNEAKLTAARQRLQESTGRLYKGFGYYDAVGGRLCQPEIEMFKKAQQNFFGAALGAVSMLTGFPFLSFCVLIPHFLFVFLVRHSPLYVCRLIIKKNAWNISGIP